MKVSEITVSLGRSIPDSKKDYASHKPMFSVTFTLDEDDAPEACYAHAMRMVQAQMDEFESALGRTDNDEPSDDDCMTDEGSVHPAAPPKSQPAGVRVTATTLKNGVGKNGKKWTLYQLEFSDGTKTSTFDKAIAIKASQARKDGSLVIPKLSQEGKFTNIDGLEILGEKDSAGGEEDFPF